MKQPAVHRTELSSPKVNSAVIERNTGLEELFEEAGTKAKLLNLPKPAGQWVFQSFVYERSMYVSSLGLFPHLRNESVVGLDLVESPFQLATKYMSHILKGLRGN